MLEKPREILHCTSLGGGWFVTHSPDWSGYIQLKRGDWHSDNVPLIPSNIFIEVVAAMIRQQNKQFLDAVSSRKLVGLDEVWE